VEFLAPDGIAWAQAGGQGHCAGSPRALRLPRAADGPGPARHRHRRRCWCVTTWCGAGNRTLCCMQALVAVQNRACVARLRMLEEAKPVRTMPTLRSSPHQQYVAIPTFSTLVPHAVQTRCTTRSRRRRPCSLASVARGAGAGNAGACGLAPRYDPARVQRCPARCRPPYIAGPTSKIRRWQLSGPNPMKIAQH
jgi:hypothetical protein